LVLNCPSITDGADKMIGEDSLVTFLDLSMPKILRESNIGIDSPKKK
jgi:hypothetical protein